MKLIELNLNRIFELCKMYNVKTLSVFGSILTNRFNDSNDVDMIVEFNNENIDDYVSNYFNFKDALTTLFKREVDLLEAKGIKNRFLLQNINRTKQVIYGWFLWGLIIKHIPILKQDIEQILSKY